MDKRCVWDIFNNDTHYSVRFKGDILNASFPFQNTVKCFLRAKLFRCPRSLLNYQRSAITTVCSPNRKINTVAMQGWASYQYSIILWYETRHCDRFWISLYHDSAQVWSFPGWKGFITVKWCDFLKLPDCSCCSFIYLYPFIHITDDWLSKNVTWLIFCEITSSHPCSTVSISTYLVKNIVMFHHLSWSHPSECTTVSHNLHDQ